MKADHRKSFWVLFSSVGIFLQTQAALACSFSVYVKSFRSVLQQDGFKDITLELAAIPSGFPHHYEFYQTFPKLTSTPGDARVPAMINSGWITLPNHQKPSLANFFKERSNIPPIIEFHSLQTLDYDSNAGVASLFIFGFTKPNKTGIDLRYVDYAHRKEVTDFFEYRSDPLYFKSNDYIVEFFARKICSY